MKLARDVPLIQNGEAEVFKELPHVLPRRKGLVESFMGSRIGANNKGILPGNFRGPDFYQSLSPILTELVFQKGIHGLRGMPLVRRKGDATQVIIKKINIFCFL